MIVHCEWMYPYDINGVVHKQLNFHNIGYSLGTINFGMHSVHFRFENRVKSSRLKTREMYSASRSGNFLILNTFQCIFHSLGDILFD